MIYFECLCETYEPPADIVSLMQSVVDRSVRELKKANEIHADVSVYFVDDDEMKRINAEQRGIDRTTDVLSFPMNDFINGVLEEGIMDTDPETGALLLGDIVISIPVCIAQSEEYGHSFERELAFLITHGMYHLMGYDHRDKQEADMMIKLQEEVLADLNISRERKVDNEF